MLLIIITMLGLLFGTATVHIWQQSCLLQETASFAAQKTAHEKYAQGIMAYAGRLLAQDAKLRKKIVAQKIVTIPSSPGYCLHGSQATITYELIKQAELLITVEVEIEGVKERLIHKPAVQQNLFTLY